MISVQLFSVLREAVGASSVTVQVDPPATGADVLDALEASHPAVADHRSSLRLAVNHSYVPDDAPIAPGDEVAVITPVSGG